MNMLENWKVNAFIGIIIIIILIEFIRIDRRPYNNNKNNNNNNRIIKESYQDYKEETINLPFKINYLNPEYSSKLFRLNNNYLSKFNENKISYQVREFETLNECVDRYRTNSLLKINDSEIKAFERLVFEMMTILENDNNTSIYLLTDILPNCSIAKGDIWLEGGMPHTHDMTIIFPYDMFRKLSIIGLDNIGKTDYAINYFGKTIIHELVHIEQRLNKDKYNILYRQWGFKQVEHLNGMEDALYFNRINPDGLENNWLWRYPIIEKSLNNKNHNNWYWIGAVHSPNSVNLRDVNYMAYPITMLEGNIASLNGIKRPFPLYQLNDYNNFFGIDTNHYHPNEIVAEYMSIYYYTSIDNKLNKNIENIENIEKNKGYKIFINEFNL
jgi:hypothetical protein